MEILGGDDGYISPCAHMDVRTSVHRSSHSQSSDAEVSGPETGAHNGSPPSSTNTFPSFRVTGIVCFPDADPHYTKRPEPTEILESLVSFDREPLSRAL